jgi:hypothetical protein
LGRQAFAPSSDRHRQVARDSSWIESIGGWPTIRAPSKPEGIEAVAALDEQTPKALAAAAAERGIEILGPPGTMP